MSRQRTFLIADTHIGHRNILKFEPFHRPFNSIEEHDEAIVERWNSVVRPNDHVWHLGDVLFGKKSFDVLARLNGTKKLILGNHDHYPNQEYLKYFTKIFGVAELGGCILSHVPVSPTQFTRYKANIHGHTHSGSVGDARYICVSAEHINLTPVPLEIILERVNETLRMQNV